jgi:hypothetical protein
MPSGLMTVFYNNDVIICQAQRQKNLQPVRVDRGQGNSKIVRRKQGFDCVRWVDKAGTMPGKNFKHEVERYLTGKDTEPWEILYFKADKSQLPVIEQALETAP